MKKLLILVWLILLMNPLFAATPIKNRDGASIEKLSSELWGGAAVLTKPDRAKVRLAGDFYPGDAIMTRDRAVLQPGQFDCLTVIIKAAFWIIY